MAQQVPWDQRILDEFIRRALLSEEDQWLMRSRIGGMSRSQQAEHLGLCPLGLLPSCHDDPSFVLSS